MPNRQWNVYVIKDPISLAIRYVGITFKDPEKRLAQHIDEAMRKSPRTHKNNWIRSLLESGLRPVVECMESGEGDRKEAERRWINHYRTMECPLVNATDGGEGLLGYRCSPETKKSILRP